MIAPLKPYPATKDSGVEWLGELPAHWEVRRLGQIGSFSKGRGGSKEDEAPHGIPCVRYGDLYTTHQYFIRSSRSFVSNETAKDYTPIKFGDLLFAASGETIDEIGKSAVNLLRGKARCGGDVILFRPHQKIEAGYLGYAMDCRPAAIQKATMGRGITIIHIYPDQLKRLGIALPPVSEQTAIARFLDHADGRIQRYIRAKKKLITLLEEQKQAIIHQAVTGEIDVRTGQPYPAYKPSGVESLRKFPMHWEIRRLGQFGGFSRGNGGTKEDEVQAGIPCIRYGDLYTTHERYIRKSKSFISRDKAHEYTSIFFGDLLFAASGETIDEIGKSAVNLIESEACCGGDVIIFRTVEDIDPRFMGFASNCGPSVQQKATMGRGITVMHIYAAQLKNMALMIPPHHEQTAIACFLDETTAEIDQSIANTGREIEFLHEYRTRLIADVVSGKLDVREAAAALPEVDPLAVDDEVDDSSEKGGVPPFDQEDQPARVAG